MTPGDQVIKSPSTWEPSDFDRWGAGEGVGVVLEVIDSEFVDVRWPSGRCYQRIKEMQKFWDLGEQEIIRPTKENLFQILNAIILCGGKIHDTHSGEARNGKWVWKSRDCCVVFRISLPDGTEENFQKLTGFKLTEPLVVHVN